MVNYQNGKIYMIESLTGGVRYYGSTTQQLSKRMVTHRSGFKKQKNITSNEVLKFNDARILLVENCPCNSREELEKKEGEYIRNNECVNKIQAGRKMNKYREDNKEKIKETNKQYYNKNKKEIKRKAKKYKEDNKEKYNEKIICECGGKYLRRHKSTHLKTKKHLLYQSK